ncbi:DNA polymerase III, delta' subunit [Nitratifractor salsuginis]|uniref:DNA polymerase III, delta' subunit n=1 Tax=Nitratifractor salsuginis (strain DSM 16511 / JCM 12458 / E9I37-1) TaxID=749222 RepID=E6X1H5_NITSE|nr:DNA polymerase III, delta' subunit [Nitratifractor salsuginis]ADV45908.1 DNA polymerase III, delta' subunit [Nitratifractor salsuginis DSM 16511]
MDWLKSRVLVTSAPFESLAEEIGESVQRMGARLIPILREGSFKVEDVSLALEKAYLASEEPQVILLGGDSFSDVVQNKLLKVIEEPPPNKSFILLFRSKASVLPTIRSRLPITVMDRGRADVELELDVKNLEIASVYDFLQKHNRIGAAEARPLVEALLKKAIESGAYDLDERALDTFRDVVRALDVGSPGSFVLTTVLLKLLAKRKRRQKR